MPRRGGFSSLVGFMMTAKGARAHFAATLVQKQETLSHRQMAGTLRLIELRGMVTSPSMQNISTF